MHIIIDTREQKPLFLESPESKEYTTERGTLREGDYTTEALKGRVHIERKSPIDFYGSLIQGHTRFRNELIRAKVKGIELVVFVECTEHIFLNKLFYRGSTLGCPGSKLQKIIATMGLKYNMRVVWCFDRAHMEIEAYKFFKHKEEENGKTTTDTAF